MNQLFCTYEQQLHVHVKEVTALMRSEHPSRFLSLMQLLTTMGSSEVDFAKVDMVMKVNNYFIFVLFIVGFLHDRNYMFW